jgi:hypothetical protein
VCRKSAQLRAFIRHAGAMSPPLFGNRPFTMSRKSSRVRLRICPNDAADRRRSVAP